MFSLIGLLLILLRHLLGRSPSAGVSHSPRVPWHCVRNQKTRLGRRRRSVLEIGLSRILR